MTTPEQTLMGLPPLEADLAEADHFEVVHSGRNYRVSYGKLRHSLLGDFDAELLLQSFVNKLNLGNYCSEAPQDGQYYLRQNGRWVPAGISSPPATDYPLMRWGNQWTRLDRADWKAPKANGIALDLNIAHVFHLDGNEDREVQFHNLPEEGRTIFLSLVVHGNGGVFKWPENIVWDEGHAPSMGPRLTVINMIWCGDCWAAHIFARL